ncbi:Gag-Pol polyprotein, partial [Mucuna pruriens]
MPNTTCGTTPTFRDYAVTRCIPNTEINSVLQFCHSAPGGSHYGSTRTTRKRRPSLRLHLRAMPKSRIGHESKAFPVSNGYSYILLAIDYVSKWVEAIATKINDTKVVVDVLKSNIFCRFGVPKALISGQGNHFCNRAMASLPHKYGVVHKVATTYHPQTNGQAEVFNREIKKTLQKTTNPSRKDWS